MLNQNILDNQDTVRTKLRGPLLVLPDALKVEAAERLYHELLTSDHWQNQDTTTWHAQKLETGDFSYRRKHIDIASPDAPQALAELNSYLNNPRVLKWFSIASGRNCDKFIASATWFESGDHISEHNDDYVYHEPGQPRYARALTFNYYLTRQWKPAYGGEFVWKEPFQSISPAFNTLVLFNVTKNSHHWVEPVSERCNSARLSVTGWFLSEIKPESFKLSR